MFQRGGSTTRKPRKPQDLEWQKRLGVLLFGASGLLHTGRRGCSAIDPNDQQQPGDPGDPEAEYLVQRRFLPDLLFGLSVLQ